jgi:hypothetical protein
MYYVVTLLNPMSDKTNPFIVYQQVFRTLADIRHFLYSIKYVERFNVGLTCPTVTKIHELARGERAVSRVRDYTFSHFIHIAPLENMGAFLGGYVPVYQPMFRDIVAASRGT